MFIVKYTCQVGLQPGRANVRGGGVRFVYLVRLYSIIVFPILFMIVFIREVVLISFLSLDVRLRMKNCRRQAYGLDLAADFSEVTADSDLAELLSSAYGGDIDSLDAYTGALAEVRTPLGYSTPLETNDCFGVLTCSRIRRK